MDWDYVSDWAAFLLRWLHIIAAIVWIGTSFYFVALDKHLRPPQDGDDLLAGDTWEIHGGGFYRVEKYRVAPTQLPEPLHWFKWEAYTTWLAGFALLTVLYYFHADTYLVDPRVADLSAPAAVAISLALLAAGCLIYEALCRLLAEHELWLAGALVGFTAVVAYLAGELFSARGAYLQVGAMLGTIMAANVLFVIIPGHWELVRAKEAGREPDPAPGLEGKRRSIHNTYLTLPVLVAMISVHFPVAYTQAHAWAVLVVLM
ncbi:MAG: urate hydroxylase PuuD, partial [Gaiellaceae bacterium]